MVSTPKPVAAPPRVSPSTTQYFYNISSKSQKHCRYLQSVKAKNSSNTSPFLYPSPKSKSNPRRSTCSLDNNDADFTTMNLPTKLQHIVQQQINHAPDPFVNHLLKTNAILDSTNGNMIKHKQLMKGSEDKNWINGCSK